ncbi:hypothetical protein HDU67_002408 [Dinochytrium kinnereticum]|nr:hypothetical protein HDU67_002408 [Dinochytrium kinnereticum]
MSTPTNEAHANGDHLIKLFNLLPHVEGGHYPQVYKSLDEIPASSLPTRFTGSNPRAFSTSIHFLLRSTEKSHLHRLKSDETWHFYRGDALKVIMLDEEKQTMTSVLIGQNFEEGEVPQFTVPHGVWFGSFSTGRYSFVGCTVSPGFDFEDFELAERDELGMKFEGAGEEVKSMIKYLTRE